MKFAIVSLLFIAAVHSSAGIKVNVKAGAGANIDPIAKAGVGANVGASIDPSAIINDVTGTVGDIANGLIGPDGVVGDGINDVGDFANDLIGGNGGVADLAGNAGGAIGDTVNDLTGTVGSLLNTLLGDDGILGDLLGDVGDFVDGVASGAGSTVDDLTGDIVGVIPKNIAGKINGVLNDALGVNGDVITNIIQSIVNGLAKGLSLNSIVAKIGNILNGLDGVVSHLSVNVEKTVKKLLASAGISSATIDAVLNVVKAVINGLKGGKPIKQILAAVPGILGNLANGNGVQLNGAYAALSSALDGILSKELIKVVINLVKQVQAGKPIQGAVATLKSVLTALAGKTGVIKGVTGLVGKGGISPASIARLRVALGHIVAPKIADALCKLIVALAKGGPIGTVLKTLGNILGGLNLGSIVGGGLGGLLGIGGSANVGAGAGVNVGGPINAGANAGAGLGIDF